MMLAPIFVRIVLTQKGIRKAHAILLNVTLQWKIISIYGVNRFVAQTLI